MEISSSASAEAAAPAKADRWWEEVRAVFVKDVRSEWRTRSAVSTILMFSLTTMVLVSFTVVTRGPGLTQSLEEAGGRLVVVTRETPTRAALLATLFWVVLYFSAMAGLPRVFVKEEEMRTAAALRLAARPSAVFAGKWCFNVALLELVAATLLPLFLLFFQPQVRNWPLLLGTLVTGTAAMAGGATILGAIVARASHRGYLMLILSFGPLLPILGLAINATAAALQGGAGNSLLAMVSYLVTMTLISGLLFERVWSR